MKSYTKYNIHAEKSKPYFRSCRSVRTRTKAEARNVTISAAGMEYSTPISPNARGSSTGGGKMQRQMCTSFSLFQAGTCAMFVRLILYS